MRRFAVDETGSNGQDDRSTSTVALLNDANPTRVQKMMRPQHYCNDGDLCGGSAAAAGGGGRHGQADLSQDDEPRPSAHIEFRCGSPSSVLERDRWTTPYSGDKEDARLQR